MEEHTPELPYELWDIIFSYVTDFYDYFRSIPRVCK